MSHKNVELRCRQYLGAMTPETALSIARQLVFGKIKNCRTLLRRNYREPPPAVLTELDRLANRARTAPGPWILCWVLRARPPGPISPSSRA